ncbi:hypothetical protein ABZ835_44895 [Streptomyces sp. NPDC047461]|uniref:hypothetical protein n=1 Tax=Streptomyces sp. NPDC047461 TaxID=3155619 RepID=UPI0033D6C4A4
MPTAPDSVHSDAGSPAVVKAADLQSVTTGCWLLRFRSDIPRSTASRYWAMEHGDIASRIPHVLETVERHFSGSVRGFWPRSPLCATAIPEEWRFDGMPELRLTLGGALRALRSPAARQIHYDEQNVFSTSLGHLGLPGSSRWWTGGFGDRTLDTAVVLIRRRAGVSRVGFVSFVHDVLARALFEAGAAELRSHVFAPWLPALHNTPGVSHDNPPHLRYHGALVVGAKPAEGMSSLLESAPVTRAVLSQDRYCTALHAYKVEQSVPIVVDGRPVAARDRGFREIASYGGGGAH